MATRRDLTNENENGKMVLWLEVLGTEDKRRNHVRHKR